MKITGLPVLSRTQATLDSMKFAYCELSIQCRPNLVACLLHLCRPCLGTAVLTLLSRPCRLLGR